MDREELLHVTLERQYLLRRGERLQIVSDLCGLQAQFANNPQYALRIRAEDFCGDTWGEGLVKIWTHRGTLHAVRSDEIGLFLSARGVEREWADSWWNIPAGVKPYWSSFIREQVARGVDGREALKAECLRAGMDPELVPRVFHGWGGLIKEMCDRGLLAYRIGTQKRFVLPDEPVWMDRDEARLILLERYFRHFGPATEADCAAFTGYRLPEVRDIMWSGRLPLERVVSGGDEYWYAGALTAGRALPRCLLLSGFDQLVLGYRDRSRFLDERDRPYVVNGSGIVYPTVMLRGRLRARWKKEPGRVVVTPFRALSATSKEAVAAKARRVFRGETVDVVFQEPLS